jgi:hypothetical protein
MSLEDHQHLLFLLKERENLQQMLATVKDAGQRAKAYESAGNYAPSTTSYSDTQDLLMKEGESKQRTLATVTKTGENSEEQANDVPKKQQSQNGVPMTELSAANSEWDIVSHDSQ